MAGKKRGTFNRAFRIVWSESKQAWQAVPEILLIRPSSISVSRRAAMVFAAASMGALSASAAIAADILPTGGQVVGGAATISQSGANMTINQTTASAVLNWQSFSIGTANSVTFNQPSSSSVALNRVLGSDPSVIQGRLNANGQVFLLNPNGVLFTNTSQVNVGGIVASTLDMATDQFMDGNYTLSGISAGSIVNQGDITATDGGTIAMIAAKVTNDGTLTANGGNVLLGAGSTVTLDLGGPVKLQVEQAAIDALIENGGAIRADGGTILLSAKAAGDLTSTVINNTGIVQAQTLATGEKGEIYLLGDMQNDRISVGGTLDASAPNGGDGGFIETSAAHVGFVDDMEITTKAASGTDGHFLIDPEDFTIAASGGDITGAALATLLGSNSVTIYTGTGADSATAQYGVSGTAGNINVNQAVSWSANTLTMSAFNNILVNAALNATGTGALAFKYGQGSAGGGSSTYTVGTGGSIKIPNPANFTYQKGTGGTVTNLVFDNNLLRFGNGTQASVNTSGMLLQPFYYDDGTAGSGHSAGWYKLTYSTYPLDIAVGLGGDGTNSWNTNGTMYATNSGTAYSSVITAQSYDISQFSAGIGAITSDITLTIGGEDILVSNKYSLATGDKFLKTVTSITNQSGAASQSNVRLWIGTRDDYVGTHDSNYKTKGNITADGFTPITATSEQAKAIKISESTGTTGAAVLFYSTSSGADTATDSCCSFSNAYGKNPRSSVLVQSGDGSYALFLRMSDLAPSASQSLTWYYAASAASQIGAAVTQVANSAGVTTTTTTTTTTATTTPSPVKASTEQVQSTVRHPVTPATVNVNVNPALNTPTTNIRVGSMEIVQLRSQPNAGGGGAVVNISSPTPGGAGGGTVVNLSSGGQPQGGQPQGGQPQGGQPQGGQAQGGQTQGGNQGGSGTAQSDGGNDANQQEQDIALLSQIEVGANDILKVFVVDGGISTPEQATGANDEE